MGEVFVTFVTFPRIGGGQACRWRCCWPGHQRQQRRRAVSSSFQVFSNSVLVVSRGFLTKLLGLTGLAPALRCSPPGPGCNPWRAARACNPSVSSQASGLACDFVRTDGDCCAVYALPPGPFWAPPQIRVSIQLSRCLPLLVLSRSFLTGCLRLQRARTMEAAAGWRGT